MEASSHRKSRVPVFTERAGCDRRVFDPIKPRKQGRMHVYTLCPQCKVRDLMLMPTFFFLFTHISTPFFGQKHPYSYNFNTFNTFAANFFSLLALSSVLLRFTVLFSHGNAVDLGQMSSFYIGLGTRINCNIFSYDYSGYGVSTGKPSEKNLYADIDAAWHALRSR